MGKEKSLTSKESAIMDKKEVLIRNESGTPEENTACAFRRLYGIVSILRSPDGCPWDREQTTLTMRRDLIEEVFEAVDALTQEDAAHAMEELGDVMLNATMISYMHEQESKFSVSDVLNDVCDKLIRRHPHVFPESQGQACVTEKAGNSAQVLSQWERIKEELEGRREECILDQVPDGFPPMLKAYKMQKKAAKKGFQWSEPSCALEKVREELEEVSQAVTELEASAGKGASRKHLEEELGDLLFSVINYGRYLGIDPEVALSGANAKFYSRFSYVQNQLEKDGGRMEDAPLSAMELLWNEAKDR